MNIDDAFNHLVTLLKQGKNRPKGGYDLYMEDVIDDYIIQHEGMQRDSNGYKFRDRGIFLSESFYSAAWELCRRGILRPGLSNSGHGGVGHNEFGKGYSVTPHGRNWLPNANYEELAAVIPTRFVTLLSEHASRFGPGFMSRGIEALSCYNSHAYLACCAMCGAAAESIILALANEKQDPDIVLKAYQGANGRSRVQTLLIGEAAEHIKREFPRYMSLLSYWRDEAAHGRASTIAEEEAFTALLSLLKFARYAAQTF